jgi:C-methyltransferase C-terminal domain/Putative zinc binding domain/Methyltransferase domain
MGEVTACGICGGKDLAPILDMGEQPLAERYDDDRRYPLALLECQDCTLVQLGYIVDGHEMFPPDHPYATGNTRVLREHFAELARQVRAPLGPGSVIVDIGANDGTFLEACPERAVRIAVEPTNQARKCREKGLITYQEFFTADLAARIAREHGQAEVITACNVLAHVPEPHDFLAGVSALLAGTFITENHHWRSVADYLQIDTIYHEHLRYYSIASLSRLLAMHGLPVIATSDIPTHGGSFRTYARKNRSDLQARAGEAAAALYGLLEGLGEPVYGIGATTRATPLLHWAGIAPFIACVCEVPGSEKIGKMMPGSSIPIVDEVRLLEDQPPFALLFSWHIAKGITRNLRAAGYKGRFIIPLPEPRIIDA